MSNSQVIDSLKTRLFEADTSLTEVKKNLASAEADLKIIQAEKNKTESVVQCETRLTNTINSYNQRMTEIKSRAEYLVKQIAEKEKILTDLKQHSSAVSDVVRRTLDV